jgi:hypothetical protein
MRRAESKQIRFFLEMCELVLQAAGKKYQHPDTESVWDSRPNDVTDKGRVLLTLMRKK